MNRIRKHRIKEEKAATSSSNNRTKEEHDLAYFIHDRVELMHQVFSVLKSKELKSLAPECVRRLTIDDLQELCLEELLGISSKRLCAILDGAEPPSDTESSSQSEQLETISLDSISSDEEILSQGSGKKKKHKHRHSKKKRRKKSKDSGDEQGESRASRAGLTVLELLELQARARAIRAQLHKEPARAAEPAAEPPSSDNDEVLIKEEPAEVVEISSDDEKPDVERLAKEIGATSQENEAETNKNNGDSQTVTKRINDLIITVPQSKPTRKIKLKRSKPTETVTKEVTTSKAVETGAEVSNTSSNTVTTNDRNAEPEPKKGSSVEVKSKSKKSKKKKKKAKEKDGSDEDEITIQLSDTEKMDLLEDLDAKNFDTVSSGDSDSSDEVEQSINENKNYVQSVEDQDKVDTKTNETSEAEVEVVVNSEGKDVGKDEIKGYVSNDNEGTIEINDLPVVTDDILSNSNEVSSKVDDNCRDQSSKLPVDNKLNEAGCDVTETKKSSSEEMTDDACEKSGGKANSNIIETEKSSSEETTDDDCEKSDDKANSDVIETEKSVNEEKSDDASKKSGDKANSDVIDIEKTVIEDKTDGANEKIDDKPESSNLEGKSDGEISDRESSEVEASDVQPEVVCISDDDGKKKKKKKKEKKSKKEKKKSGFREGSDENFYKDKQVEDSSILIETKDDDDDVYEYLEISDDSSCYEVEGVSVLSKEPTAEEIEAFSARMDAIDLDKEETVIPNEDITEKPDLNDAEIENISWKDRYLGSKKVKRVLTTSNILNAIRKKNRELKKKLEEAKKVEQEKEEIKETEEPAIEDGTMEQYETLQGSTKYVNPVKEVDTTVEQNENDATEPTKEDSKEQNENVTREMKKDAKMLLKMYKRLLKYNDVNKQKDPSKKKKKKQKKNKDKEKDKVV